MQRVCKVTLALAIIGLSAPAFGEAGEPDTATTAPAEVSPGISNPAPAPAETAPQTKLQELIRTRLSQIVDRKPEQAAVGAFYRERSYQPIWSANGVALPRTRAAVEYLGKVAVEGLDPRDYPTPDFSRDMNEQTAAANDLQLTASILKYARHASAGRVSFTRVSGAILVSRACRGSRAGPHPGVLCRERCRCARVLRTAASRLQGAEGATRQKRWVLPQLRRQHPNRKIQRSIARQKIRTVARISPAH